MRFIVAAFLIMASFPAFTQYKININYTKPKDSILFFRVTTFDDKLFIPKDTLVMGKKTAKIIYDKSIFGGIYYLYLPQSRKKIMLCLENNDNFTLNLNGENWEDSLTCTNAKNKIFLDYQKLENKYQYLDSQYSDLQKKGNATLKAKEALYKIKTDTLSAFRHKAMLTLNPGGLLYKYFKILNERDAYAPNRNDYNGREAFIKKFNFKDAQLYFTPILKDILYEYLSAYPLSADSTLKGIDVIMSKMDCKDKPYANTFNYFSSILQNSSIKENMKGYTAFIEKYLINNKCSFLPKNSVDQFVSNYKRIKQISSIDTITNIVLKDTTGIEQSLRSQIGNYDYTIISFYDPTCEHCQFQMPELDSTLMDIRSKVGLKILNFAVCNTSRALESEWKKFIIEKKLYDNYTHVILDDKDAIREAYAAYANPMFYLIDNKGNILLKKANIGSIKKLILTQKN
jgi:hypothetical protein